LTGLSLFVVAAGVWLAVMENILKHDGYGQRTAIATCIAIQGLATLLLVLRNGPSMYRALVSLGAVGLAVVGVSAIQRTLDTSRFEGFALVIGCALIVQSVLTLIAVYGMCERKTA
jgi:hypothetical protein